MAVVRGIREKVHLPLYDAKRFDKGQSIDEQVKQLGNVIRFFVDVQNKTKLETNQQESSVLSHYNTYETRAMRVVIEPPKKHGDDSDEFADRAFIERIIYNTTTTLIVGEKVMIQAPTWFFPSGAGPASLEGVTNGAATPEATLRFAEPVSISHQQNFRVELEFPRGVDGILNNAPGSNGGKTTYAQAQGPAKIWVVLDGYITRDVQ